MRARDGSAIALLARLWHTAWFYTKVLIFMQMVIYVTSGTLFGLAVWDKRRPQPWWFGLCLNAVGAFANAYFVMMAVLIYELLLSQKRWHLLDSSMMTSNHKHTHTHIRARGKKSSV